MLLWLWYRWAAAAPVQALAWEGREEGGKERKKEGKERKKSGRTVGSFLIGIKVTAKYTGLSKSDLWLPSRAWLEGLNEVPARAWPLCLMF